MRRNVALIAGVAIAAVTITPHAPRLIWNASASVPEGLYRVAQHGGLSRGALVLARPEPRIAQFAAMRGYLPRNVPLLKHAAGLPSDRVCNDGGKVFINGRKVATALSHDARKRPLPQWRGCITLAADAVFLLNPGVPSSFDGRYFGPLSTSSILGIAVPLWTP